MNSGLFTSKTGEWETPQDFFDKLEEEFGGFDLDVCATKENAKCREYWDKHADGLARDWRGKCWMNPPYGREIGKWMKRALFMAESGIAELVVCLVPARTDTAWWHDYAMKGEIRFIRGRLRFGGGQHSAPFPSAVVIFRAEKK